MSRSKSVSPMSRVMLRSEFEKRLADYSQQILKALKTYEQQRIAPLEARVAELEAEKANAWKDLVPAGAPCADDAAAPSNVRLTP